VPQLSGERRGSEGPVTPDVETPHKDHERHELPPAGGSRSSPSGERPPRVSDHEWQVHECPASHVVSMRARQARQSCPEGSRGVGEWMLLLKPRERPLNAARRRAVSRGGSPGRGARRRA
jgi:hypothetical protein